MFEYVSPKGEVKDEAVNALIEAVKAQIEHALAVANDAWKQDVLAVGGWDVEGLRQHLNRLPERIKYLMDCTARQIAELHQTVATYAEGLDRPYSALQAGNLISRLLGMPTDQQRGAGEADDRSAGYPLRRFAEFGILPGYEFPTEPAALRLLGDPHEEDPVSVTRRFGIGQFQPEATVYARTRRWKVVGLDTASPWNPRNEGSSVARTASAPLAGSDTTRMSRSAPVVVIRHLGSHSLPTSSPDSSPPGMRTPSSTRKNASPSGIWSRPTHNGMATSSPAGPLGRTGPSGCLRMKKSAGSMRGGRLRHGNWIKGCPSFMPKERAICSALRVAVS